MLNIKTVHSTVVGLATQTVASLCAVSSQLKGKRQFEMQNIKKVIDNGRGIFTYRD